MRQLELNAVPASNGGPASGKATASVIDRIENDIHRYNSNNINNVSNVSIFSFIPG